MTTYFADIGSDVNLKGMTEWQPVTGNSKPSGS